jgi:uncharacterized membrane protein
VFIFESGFNNPKIRMTTKIRFSGTDKLLELLGVLATLALLILPIVYYTDLPEQIPTHYNFKGLPDAWSSKASIWILPVIGILLYLGLALLNYFVITTTGLHSEKNHKQSVSLASVLRMMQIIKLMLSLTFTYIVWRTIEISLNHTTGLGRWFLPVFIILMLGVPILFLLKKRP